LLRGIRLRSVVASDGLRQGRFTLNVGVRKSRERWQ
jgi:hypothetical protein